jgi:hypothetical protein
MHKNFIKRLLLLGCAVLMSSAHSCERADNKNPITNAKFVETALTCNTDTDCTVVKDDCCGCNQGGKQRAIAINGSQAWLDKLASDCADTFCAQVISRDASCGKKAVCLKSQCQLQ